MEHFTVESATTTTSRRLNSCLRPFNKIQTFVASLAYLVLVSALYRSYLIAIVTTVEKQFHFRSSQTGLWMSSYEISHVLVVAIVAYLGAKGHKPKILGICAVVASIIVTCGCLPHFIFGTENIDQKINNNASNSCYVDDNLCSLDSNNASRSYSNCEESEETSTGTYTILILVNVGVGFALSGLYSLGISYVEDNSSKTRSPHLMGIVFSMFALGPVVGFGLGAAITASKGKDELFSPWWIGFIVIGVSMLGPAVPLVLTPRKLPNAERHERKNTADTNTDSIENLLASTVPSVEYVAKRNLSQFSVKDFFRGIWRLLRNPVYMGVNLMTCAHLFALVGMAPFVPKYIEEQFGQSPWVANLIIAFISATSAAVGLYLGGYVMSRFKLSLPGAAKLICAMNVVGVLGMLAAMFIGCDTGITASLEQSLNVSCNVSSCGCTSDLFHPVCTFNNVTFRSPCHAGCTETNQCAGNHGDTTSANVFYNCSCLLPPEGSPPIPDEIMSTTVMDGACPSEISCTTPLVMYTIVSFIQAVCIGMSALPSTVIYLRNVDSEDKPVALAFHSMMTALLSFIPGPIISGAIVDHSCEFWQAKPCEPGATFCQAYDPEKFRLYLHGFNIIFRLIAVVLGYFVWYKCQKHFRSSLLSQDDMQSILSVDSRESDGEMNTDDDENILADDSISNTRLEINM